MNSNAQGPGGRPSHVVGIDIGGTFTDIVLIDPGGKVHQRKVPTTPPRFEAAVVRGLAELFHDASIEASRVTHVMHGTTLATNAILEGRGATVGLLTTEGFRDVLELGRMRHPSLYDLSWQKPKPLVPRRRRLEVRERINARGDVECVPSADQVDALIETLMSGEVESIAISLINAYTNPAHEQFVADRVRASHPEIYTTSSHEVLPEMKEYERTSTTVVNAYVLPIVNSYLSDLALNLGKLGVECSLLIMQSGGGLIPSDLARAKPVQIVESGPAAGVTGATALAARLGKPNVIALDMGGTTAKASLIESGEPFHATEYEVGAGINTRRSLMRGGGYVIRVPSLDISEVGAGGGSIFWIDNGGAPHVGPRSAGAVPGPVCYGNGAAEPTLTDANVVLGYLNPTSIAGGAQRIHADLAFRAIADLAAPRLGLDVFDTAYGIYEIAIANMSRAVSAVTSERGRDPRNFELLAFGGAGPMHAAAMAGEFGIETVIVPPAPGLFSALGLTLAPVQHYGVWSYRRRSVIDFDDINAGFTQMELRTRGELRRAGHEEADIVIHRSLDLRYVGQSTELSVQVIRFPIDREEWLRVRERFDQEHENTYGHRSPDEKFELVNARLWATITPRGIDSLVWRSEATADQPATFRRAYFGRRNGFIDTPVFGRFQLTRKAGSGPMIVEDMDATTIVPPGWSAYRDHADNIVLQAEV